METITSLTNTKIKDVVRLRMQSKQRRAAGLFCVESDRELLRALDAGYRVDQIYLGDQAAGSSWLQRIDAGRTHLYQVTEPVLEKISYRQNPQGFVAVLQAKPTAMPSQLTGDLFVVCSGIEKPGNIGAMLRTADAAGASAMLIDDEQFDLYNPNCIRASTGAVFGMPVICATREALIDKLKQQGIRIIAAMPQADRLYTDQDLTGPVAFALGTEHDGLDDHWKQAADVQVSLPMHGTADSLNVSVTAAVLLYEAVRQRGVSSP